MKYTRNELKNLVKECLVELLAEGLGEQMNESVSRKRDVRQAQSNQAQRQQRSAQQRKSVVPSLMEAVKASSGGNSVLESILADTAATTLQTQMGAERNQAPVVASDPASFAVAQSTPEELFGSETTSKWADLAFNTPSPRIPH